MTQTITIKYLPAAATKPRRLKAVTTSGVSMTRSLDSLVGTSRLPAENLLHAFLDHLGWGGTWHTGTLNTYGDLVAVQASETPAYESSEF